MKASGKQSEAALHGADDRAHRAARQRAPGDRRRGRAGFDPAYHRARREILSGAALTLLRVLFKQAFIEFGQSSFLARLEPFDGVNLSDEFLKMPRLPKGRIGVCENLLHTAFCFRTELGKWRVEFGGEIPTAEDGVPRPVADIMLDVNRAFEAAVRRDPANWFWVHNRWKLPVAAPVPPAGPRRANEQLDAELDAN